MDRYRLKVDAMGRGDLHQTITVQRYGHCSFSQDEVQNAFERLVQMVHIAPAPTPTFTPASTSTSTPISQRPVPSTGAPVVQSVQEQGPLARAWAWLVETVLGLVQ